MRIVRHFAASAKELKKIYIEHESLRPIVELAFTEEERKELKKLIKK